MRREPEHIERRSFLRIAAIDFDSESKSIVFNFGSDFETKKAIELLIKNKYELFLSPEAEAALKIPGKTKAEDILPEDEFPAEYN